MISLSQKDSEWGNTTQNESIQSFVAVRDCLMKILAIFFRKDAPPPPKIAIMSKLFAFRLRNIGVLSMLLQFVMDFFL